MEEGIDAEEQQIREDVVEAISHSLEKKSEEILEKNLEGENEIDFGGENEKIHRKLSLDECELYLEQGEFPAGSMAPKIGSLMEAALHRPGLSALLCQPGDALLALRGETGTTIVVEH